MLSLDEASVKPLCMHTLKARDQHFQQWSATALKLPNAGQEWQESERAEAFRSLGKPCSFAASNKRSESFQLAHIRHLRMGCNAANNRAERNHSARTDANKTDSVRGVLVSVSKVGQVGALAT